MNTFGKYRPWINFSVYFHNNCLRIWVNLYFAWNEFRKRAREAPSSLALGSSHKLVSNIFLGSLLSSFLKAGFAEEITKFAILLIVVRIVKPKNVYEYGLLGAGVGFGFTGVEELLYGGSNPVVVLIRIPSFGAHMMLGLIMGLCYGLAKFRKQNNFEGSGKYMAMSLLIPMAIHTVYDAVTVSNKALSSTNDNVIMAGVIVALLVLLLMVVLQFYSFYWFKKNSSELCEKKIEK